MSTFLSKFKKSILFSVLDELGDVTYKSKWKKDELIEQIIESGPKKYCGVLTKEQLIVGLKYHKLSKTGSLKTLKNRLVKKLDDGKQGFGVGSSSNKDVEYTILVKDGRYSCTCPDFHYRGDERPCKHIKEIKKKIKEEGGFTDEEEVISFKNFPQKTKCLIIGNTNYSGSPLKNPGKDARAMQKILKSGGHTTTLILDATRDTMEEEIQTLKKKISSRQGVVLYFSGHGCEIDGIAHMMPIESKEDPRSGSNAYGINVDEVVKSFSKAKFRVIILDACRSKVHASLAGSPDTSRDTLRWYSTSQSKYAYDGKNMSPFTSEVVKHMGKKMSLFEIIMAVQLDVFNNHGNLQTPETRSTLTKNWYPKGQ